jgi:hypothetical protein
VCGDVIQLCETIYDGTFILKDDNITIQGVNETKSIIQFPFASTTTSIFSITASHCCIKNLSVHSLKYDKNKGQSPRIPVLRISGDNNSLSNISIYNGQISLYVAGNNNTFDNFSITGSIYFCVNIRGNGNIFLNGSVTFCSFGYFIIGNENVISSLQCKDVVQGASIKGNNNTIQDITYKMANPGEVFEKLPILSRKFFAMAAVCIKSGKNNSVSTVTTEGTGFESAEYRTWSIILYPETKFCKVEKCRGDGQNKDVWMIFVQGESHTLIDVDGGLCFKVGGTGHKLDKCRAVKLLKVGADCLDEVKNCNFPSVVREELGPEAVVDNP